MEDIKAKAAATSMKVKEAQWKSRSEQEVFTSISPFNPHSTLGESLQRFDRHGAKAVHGGGET